MNIFSWTRQHPHPPTLTPLGRWLGREISCAILGSITTVVPCVGARICGDYGPFCGSVIAGTAIFNVGQSYLLSPGKEGVRLIGSKTHLALVTLAAICFKALATQEEEPAKKPVESS